MISIVLFYLFVWEYLRVPHKITNIAIFDQLYWGPLISICSSPATLGCTIQKLLCTPKAVWAWRLSQVVFVVSKTVNFVSGPFQSWVAFFLKKALNLYFAATHVYSLPCLFVAFVFECPQSAYYQDCGPFLNRKYASPPCCGCGCANVWDFSIFSLN